MMFRQYLALEKLVLQFLFVFAEQLAKIVRLIFSIINHLSRTALSTRLFLVSTKLSELGTQNAKQYFPRKLRPKTQLSS